MPLNLTDYGQAMDNPLFRNGGNRAASRNRFELVDGHGVTRIVAAVITAVIVIRVIIGVFDVGDGLIYLLVLGRFRFFFHKCTPRFSDLFFPEKAANITSSYT